jgi:hypothetical protein
MTRARRTWAWVACVCTLAVGAVAGCDAVLGIKDKQLPTGGPNNPLTGPGDQCAQDSDCPATGCYLGQCDDALHVCRYSLCRGRGDVCQQAACQGGTTCSQSKIQYAFQSSTIALPDATLGCGGDPSVCVASVYPFVLVGTTSGMQAVLVADVTNAAPHQFAVALPFAPAVLLASPPNVYAIGSLANGQLPIAWVAIPADPTTTSLTAKSATLAYPFGQYVPYAGPIGNLYLLDPEPSQQFPVALLQPPLANGPIVVAPTVQEPPDGSVYEGGMQQADLSGGGYAMYRSPGVGSSASIVGPSGSRLVYQSGVAAQYGILHGAGTPSAYAQLPQGAGVGNLENLVDGGPGYAASPEGSLIWAFTKTSAYGSCTCFVNDVLCALVHSGEADYLTGNENDLVGYGYSCPGTDGGCHDPLPSPPASLPYPFYVTALDSESTLSVVVNSMNASGPPAIVTSVNNVGNQTRVLGQQVNLATQKIGLTSSNHLAFVLTQSPGLSVTVLDPSCP